jgi:acetyl esterase/lipase
VNRILFVSGQVFDGTGPHGPVPVRIYAPDSSSGAPCLVWMHGGGFIGGHLDMPEADWVAREMVTRAGIVVVSVDYRLCTGGVAYPVPHDDVVAAMRWVRGNAAALGADGGRISIGGASAGATLAAYDDLRPSGEAFAAALALAGVDVRQVQVQAMLHGFLNLPASIEPVSDALDLIAEAVAGRVRLGGGAR